MIRLLLLLTMLSAQAGPVRYISGTYVTVYHPLNIDAATAKNYLAVLDQMYSDDSQRFGINVAGRLRVRLCHDAYDFSNLTGAGSFFSPLWKDNVLYVVAQGNLDDPDYRAALGAGVIQGLLRRIRANGAPRWLIYSAAIYESGKYKECTAPPVESVKYFADLDEKIQTASSTSDLADLCFYLGNTGKFLDLRFGVGAMVRLVQEFQHQMTLNKALNKLFHVSSAELERDWHEYLVGAVEGK